jgi:ribosomal-protein-alanine N-acetyltransferase
MNIASDNDIFRKLPVIETSRLRLRKLLLRDAADMFEYASLPEVAENLTWECHRNISDSLHYLRMILKQYEDNLPSPWGIVLKDNGKLIGTVGFNSVSYQNAFAEVGYVLSRHYWGNGLMSEALSEVVKFGFEVMNLNRIEATCNTQNRRSESVMKKCGFSFEGILRGRLLVKNKFLDLKMYSIMKSEYLKMKKSEDVVQNEKA